MKSLLFALMVLMAYSCTQGSGNEDEAVREVIMGIIDADNGGDIQRVLSFYDESAVLIPPARPRIVGAAAIRSNYESIFAASKLDLRVQIDSIRISGNTALSHGLTIGSVTSATDGTVKQVRDSYVMMLERKGNDWKIMRLAWDPQ